VGQFPNSLFEPDTGLVADAILTLKDLKSQKGNVLDRCNTTLLLVHNEPEFFLQVCYRPRHHSL
jgi:hypothetical protein